MRRRVAAAISVGFASVFAVAACVSLDGLAGGSLEGGTPLPDSTMDDGPAGDGPVGTDGLAEAEASAPCADADTDADPHNCGACGHDCLGSSCSAGVCAPAQLVAGLDMPSCVAVDLFNVYWATSSCPGGVCIGGQPLTGHAGPYVIGSMSDDVGVAWADCTLLPNGSLLLGAVMPPGAIDEFPQGATIEKRLAYGTPAVVRVAADPVTGFAWTTIGGGVYTCASACNDTPNPVAGTQNTPTGIAIYGPTVYWTNLGDGTIASSPFDGDGGNVTVVATDAASPSDLAVDVAGVYWVEQSSGNVVVLPSGGTNPLILATGPVGADAVVLDGERVYWTSASGTVMRVGRDGGSPLTLASGQAHPADVAVDSQWVYWATGVADGGIFRVAK